MHTILNLTPLAPFIILLFTCAIDLKAQESWIYECRYLCSEDCRGRMYLEGVDIKCACEDCQPMLTQFTNDRLTAIYAGTRAMKEVQNVGKYFYHYVDELNDFVIKYWSNDGYQITKVEYHKLQDRRFVKYFLQDQSGRRTAVAFMNDKFDNHFMIRCALECDDGPFLDGVSPRAQSYCQKKNCSMQQIKVQIQLF